MNNYKTFLILFLLAGLMLISRQGKSQAYGEPILAVSVDVSEDATITEHNGNSAMQTTPNGNSEIFSGYAWTSSWNLIKSRGLMKFNLSAIPSNAVITYAALHLYGTIESPPPQGDHLHHLPYTRSNACDLYRVTDPWQAASVTWSDNIDYDNLTSSQLQQTHSIVCPPYCPQSSDDYPVITSNDAVVMTEFVQYWIDNPTENYGIIMILENELELPWTQMVFASKDNQDESKRPRLLINYYIPFEPTFAFDAEIIDAECGNELTCGIQVSVHDEHIYDMIEYAWYDEDNNLLPGENASELFGYPPGTYTLEIEYTFGVAYSYPNAFSATAPFTFEIGYGVDWGPRENVTVSNYSTLTKDSPDDWDGGAVSYNSFIGNDNWVEFEYDGSGNNNNAFNAFGLNQSGVEIFDHTYNNIDKGFYINSSNQVLAIEPGGGTSQVAGLSAGTNVFRIETDGNDVRYYKGGSLIHTYTYTAPYTPSPLESVKANMYTETSVIDNTRASVDCDQTSLSFVELRKKIDGGYYKTHDYRLYFTFDEEYDDVDKEIDYKIYDNINDEVVTGFFLEDIDGHYGNLIKYGDNRYELNVEGLECGYYVLEISNEKKEKWYLRFQVVVDGGWSAWSAWGACDVQCGFGEQTRTRTCDNPAPACGGLDCVGSAVETRPCIGPNGPCPVDGGWSDPVAMNTCPDCGPAYITYVQYCNNPAPAYGGEPCDVPPGGTPADTMIYVYEEECEIDYCIYQGCGCDALDDKLHELGLLHDSYDGTSWTMGSSQNPPECTSYMIGPSFNNPTWEYRTLPVYNYFVTPVEDPYYLCGNEYWSYIPSNFASQYASFIALYQPNIITTDYSNTCPNPSQAIWDLIETQQWRTSCELYDVNGNPTGGTDRTSFIWCKTWCHDWPWQIRVIAP